MSRLPLLKTLLCFSLLALALPVSAEPETETNPQELKSISLGQITPLYRSKLIYLAGQPTKEDLPLIQKDGVKTVVNLRTEKELDWDEAGLVRMLELDYVAIPFLTPETLTPAVFDQCRGVLNDQARHPLILHSASANRVGAIWLVHRVLDDDVEFDAALKEAKQVGLRTPGYIDQAKAYIAAQKK
ncbi:fused DSP-PTPase phosphatase/NAD kinase-like protein [Gimesia sp.]|uniref:fused DSP-PTPase phosphatase/NAD kinase-like protein n=1 Tax=Gimesia sp. TaxID=2024833 RepID=UPI003A937810